MALPWPPWHGIVLSPRSRTAHADIDPGPCTMNLTSKDYCTNLSMHMAMVRKLLFVRPLRAITRVLEVDMVVSLPCAHGGGALDVHVGKVRRGGRVGLLMKNVEAELHSLAVGGHVNAIV